MILASRLLFPFSILSVSLALTACNQQVETAEISKDDETVTAELETVEDKGTDEQLVLRIATEGAYPPFNYTNTDGSLGGFDVDVANALCEQMQAKCEIVAQEWDGIIPGLLTNKYDAILAGMSVTAERLEKVDFTEPYFTNTMVWLAKKDGGFDPSSVVDKSLGGQRSTTLGQYLLDNYDGQNGNSVNLYDTYENAYLDLKSGRTDAVLSEKVSSKEWLQDESNADFGLIGEEIDNDDNIAIAVRKDDELLSLFNTAMAEIRENGQLAELEQQHFGE